MSITFARDPGALRSADHCLVVATAAFFARAAQARKVLGRLLGADAAAQAARLAGQATVGLLGGTSTSLVGPRRLTVAVLPDKISRHNAPARAESVRKVVAATPLGNGRSAILLCLEDKAHLLAAANAVGRAMPEFTRKTRKQRPGGTALACIDAAGKLLLPDAWTEGVVTAARTAAVLVDTPPTELDPAALAARARAILRGARVRVREIRGEALLAAGLRGIHAVGRCARSEPRLLVAEWSPPPATGPHIVLVGKGVTYDTGGLHLKARGMMEGMKSDMGGAAAVLGAFDVLVQNRIGCRLSLVLCLAENAIGPDAYKPDDILELHSGKTVEINNTDAEGRLLLADGVSWAARRLRATVIIDAATLTGAQLVATGNLHAAVVSNDAALEQTLLAAGQQSGDLTWPLPFAPEFYKSEFQSPIADMRNSVKNRSNAQSSCAAQFIHWHIEDQPVAWAHVDLAGPAFRDDRGTGYGVALLVEAVRQLSSLRRRSLARKPPRRAGRRR